MNLGDLFDGDRAGTWMVLNGFNFSHRLLLYNSIALGIVFSSTDSVATLQILDKVR